VSSRESDDQSSPAPSRARPAALLVVRITPADVGRRVSVRHRYDATTLTDVVGQLLTWSDDVLRIERRDGEVVDIAVGDVVAAKVVPPPPLRSRADRPGSDRTRRDG
jgi:hypothetical protein